MQPLAFTTALADIQRGEQISAARSLPSGFWSRRTRLRTPRQPVRRVAGAR